MNKIYITGNLIADPETRTVSSGKTVCTLRIAEHDGDKTNFFNILAWGVLGEACSKYLTKGRKVLLFGKVAQREYINKEGKKMSIFNEVFAEQIEFLDRPKQENNENEKQIKPIPAELTPIDDDSLPF